MLPLSAYRDAVHLDEQFPQIKDDSRSIDELINAVLNGLEGRPLDELHPERAVYTLTGLFNAARTELIKRRIDEISPETLHSIQALLNRHSAILGRTTGANLMRINEMWPSSDYGSARNVAVWRGDVRELVVDAVVNAALPDLQGCQDPMHPCIDNYIQGQAGPWLRNDCATIHRIQGKDEEVGSAKLTRGYCLPANYVLHTVSPHIEGEPTDADRQALANCYTSCLDVALEKGDIHSVSFCALSTGENGFPFEEASSIALSSVNQWLDKHGTSVIRLIVFNIFEDEDAERYTSLLSNWIAE